MNPLELPIVGAVRRNHALEHATLHVLTERHPGARLAGRSDWRGFTLYGNIDIHEVADGVLMALQRLRAGERQLAIHPRCGTNLATSVVLAGAASYAVWDNKRRSTLLKILGLAAGLAAAVTLAQPLGEKLQEHVTTSSDVARLCVVSVCRQEAGALIVHRISTRLE